MKTFIKTRAILVVLALTTQIVLILSSEPGKKELNRARKTLVSEKSDSSTGEPDGNESCTNDYVVDHMRLSLSWVPGVCLSKMIECKTRNDFVIKGLRPQMKEGVGVMPVRCCTKERFDEEVIKPIEPELKEDWPSLDANGDDEKVWPHEWDIYGRCTAKIKGISSIFHYFNFAVKNFRKLALKSQLESRGFHPRNRAAYFGQNIVTTLQELYKVRPSLECAKLAGSPKEYVLTAVHFCYDTNLAAIDCPYTDMSAQCSGELFYSKTT